eukprot:2641833-Rhodomonas_salina.1
MSRDYRTGHAMSRDYRTGHVTAIRREARHPIGQDQTTKDMRPLPLRAHHQITIRTAHILTVRYYSI